MFISYSTKYALNRYVFKRDLNSSADEDKRTSRDKLFHRAGAAWVKDLPTSLAEPFFRKLKN